MVHHSVCPVCSSTILNEKFSCMDYLVSHETFSIVGCGGCGFNFTQDHPDEKEAGKYYESEEYIPHSDTSEGVVNKLYRISRRVMLKRKSKLVRKVTGLISGRILDIGSGTGYFLNAMRLSGWQPEGIEINERARNFSATEFRLAIHDPEQIAKLEQGNYDCITLWHVLEHFHDAAGYLREVTRLLKPDGSLIIALPNCSSYDAKYYKHLWAAWDVPRHLWHFTPPTFRRFAEKKGFKIVSIKTLPLDVFYISMLSEKHRSSKLHFLKGFIKGFWFWFRCLFNKERSSSLIYILKKTI